MRRPRAAWLPSPQQVLLLRACLWRDERALEAWREWRSEVPDLGAVEAGSLRLLPLLYRNLGPALNGDPGAAWLKDAYRTSWTASQLCLRTARHAIEALRGAGLEILALKGAALIGTAYEDAGARPLADADLAVEPGRAGDAVRALEQAGFVAREQNPQRLLEVRHSLAFRDPGGREVDLHRGTLWLPGLDEDFWRGSVEGEVAGAAVRILNPTDQLLHVCAHGAAWNPVHPIRWAADAFKTIEVADGSLDWERLAAMGSRSGLSLPLAGALACLAEDLGARVPEATRLELARAPASAGERRAYEALAQPPSLRRSLAMASWFRQRYRAQAGLEGKRGRPAGFVRYMQGFWGLTRPSQVPAHAARRLLRRKV